MEDMPRNERVTGGAIDLAEVRRTRMRAQARSRHGSGRTQPDRFATPEWLDRSFVLPLTKPERTRATDVPSQSTPLHDDLAADVVDSATAPRPPDPAFQRPPAPEIDFGRVIRRSDLNRALARGAVASAGITGLALVVYLLLGSSLALGVTLGFALVTLAALGVRSRVAAAPVPQLRP